MTTRFPQGPAVLLATMLVGGGLFLSACTSESPPNATADSTAASAATTTSQTVPSSPSLPTDLEKRRDDRSVAEKLTDTSVEAQVKRALVRESSLRVFPFQPTVIDGHLILRGDVNTPEQYNRAERIAGQVDGVRALTNRLTMGGRPVTEERLAESKDEPAGSSEEDTAVYHTVRQGDTLWDIARKYRASVDQIKTLNDLRSNNLRPGQRIRVR